MTFTAILQKIDSAVWHYVIPVPDEIVEQFVENDNRRVVCMLNGEYEFQCALMPSAEVGYFININKEIRKQLGINVGDSLEVNLKKDNSKYGLPVPEEFQTLMELDDEGRQVFESLTMGKQRSLIYIVAKPKRSETRLKKAVVIIDYLKATGGELDFKELNQAFKNANRI